MIIVGAMAWNGVIGRGDGLPWELPEEYSHFLELTRGQTLILGRRSYEIFGRDLSSAHNIVISRRWSGAGRAAAEPSSGGPSLEVVPSIDEAVQAAQRTGGTIFSAGGATVYLQTMPLAEAMYVSYIKGHFEGDAYFPQFSKAEWAIERRDDRGRFEFVVYRRRAR